MDNIAKFLIENQTKRAQKWHLRCTLLPNVDHSTFHKFVYFYNGSPGNISITEDILDRILAYLRLTFSPL